MYYIELSNRTKQRGLSKRNKYLIQRREKNKTQMKNWKTTVAGLFAGLPTILGYLGVSIPEPISKLILAIGVVVAAYLAKDKNVTGGTVQQ